MLLRSTQHCCKSLGAGQKQRRSRRSGSRFAGFGAGSSRSLGPQNTSDSNPSGRLMEGHSIYAYERLQSSLRHCCSPGAPCFAAERNLSPTDPRLGWPMPFVHHDNRWSTTSSLFYMYATAGTPGICWLPTCFRLSCLCGPSVHVGSAAQQPWVAHCSTRRIANRPARLSS